MSGLWIITFVLVSASIFTSTSANMNANGDIDWKELVDLIQDPQVLLIDVRNGTELEETGVIPTSINIPLHTFEDTLKNTSPEDFLANYNRTKPELDSSIVLSCRSGNRSRTAQNIALGLGYTNVKNYRGGWLDWETHL